MKPACTPIRRPMTLFVPIPETGDPYIFLDKVPRFKPISQELWLLFWQIQITSNVIHPVWLIATCFWICRLNIFQRYWHGRILPWRHFFIWWGKKILIYWRCGYREIIWMGNGSHSRPKAVLRREVMVRCLQLLWRPHTGSRKNWPCWGIVDILTCLKPLENLKI